MAQDYYQTLGVSRTASQAEVQKAYRKLARKYHPDLNPDDKTAQDNFKKVQEAYDVLNDPQKREMYDRYGSAFESVGGAGPQRGPFQRGSEGYQEVDWQQIFGGGSASATGGFGSFEDILQQFAGGARTTRRPSRRTRGADIEHELHVPFKTAIGGGQAELLVRRADGKVNTISVKIPAGIEDGKKLTLAGQGEPSTTGGPPGDIVVVIRVAEHPHFRRIGDDLEIAVPVTLAEAALGAKIDIPTPRGEIALKIPAGTSSGKRFRIKGYGVPRGKGRQGDLYAAAQIVIPAALDEESQQLARQFDKRQPLQPRADLRW